MTGNRAGEAKGRWLAKALGTRKFRAAVSLALFALMFFFFYRIAFLGDYPGHYTFAVDLKLLKNMSIPEFIAQEKDYHILSYPAWHLAFLFLLTLLNACLNLISPDFIGTYGRYAIVIGFENALILVGTFWLTYAFIGRFSRKGEEGRGYAFVLSIALLFAGPLYLPMVNQTYDLGQLLLTPWYNPTTIAVKPLAAMSLWIYLELLEARGKGSSERGKSRENRLFLLLGIVLFVSGLVKPSFFQMFVPALFLFCVIEVIATRFGSFFFCFKTGLAVLPVCFLALFQLWISFYSQEGKGVRLGIFHGWSVFTDHILFSALLSVAFPLFLCILRARELWKDKALFLSMLCFFSGAAQYAVLYEENNEGCGNFSWGASLGTFLVFLVCAAVYGRGLGRTTDGGVKNDRDIRADRGVNIIAGGLLFLHTACGLIYFIRMFTVSALWTRLI